MSTLRTTIGTILLCFVALLAAGCGSGGSGSDASTGAKASKGSVGSEEDLIRRVGEYWDLRVQGETIRRYQEYMAADFKAETSIEKFVKSVSGAAIYKAAAVKKVQIAEDKPEARVLVAYDWHINPKIAPVKPTTKTAQIESVWIYEEKQWRMLRVVPEEEHTLL